MRWLVIPLVVVLMVLAVGLLRRAWRGPVDGDRQVRDLAASAEARRRLDDHRNPTDGSNVRGTGGAIL